MTVKNLIETMVGLLDKVFIIDLHEKTRSFSIDNDPEFAELKKNYYKRTVKKWIHFNMSPSKIYLYIEIHSKKGE